MEAKIGLVLYNFYYRSCVLFATYTITVLHLGIPKFLSKRLLFQVLPLISDVNTY